MLHQGAAVPAQHAVGRVGAGDDEIKASITIYVPHRDAGTRYRGVGNDEVGARDEHQATLQGIGRPPFGQVPHPH
ncbi:hypothetical protein AZA_83761 [Nitrospirillum viridazoti Y2]|nr:hypothetical protein AZA_83761 [Nitrospirillum amazonense Y2]